MTFDQILQGKRPYWILTILCALLFIPGLWTIPPMDRDEARYVQASRQMMETGDLINIRFQEKARNKKPAGIYWLQSASVSVLSSVETREVWAYRVPSVLAAFGTVIATFMFGSFLFGRKAGFVAASILATTVMATTEAHLAKTDATLMFFTALVMVCLGRVYINARNDQKTSNLIIYGGWAALGGAILIKGPVTVMVALLAMIALWIADKDKSWFKNLKSLSGVVLALAIALPWFIAISMSAQGSGFVSEAVGKDLIPKLIGGQESHGAPPGYYLLLITATFFPGSLILWPSLWVAFKNRTTPAVRFCLAWLIPAWIMFEIVPTKLPHYTLPTYPALALLCGAACVTFFESWKETVRKKVFWPIYLLWSVIALVLPAAAIVLPVMMGEGVNILSALGGVIVLAGVAITLIAFLKQDFAKAYKAGLISAVLVFATVFTQTMPALDKIWLSPRSYEAVLKYAEDPSKPVATAGYHEPSQVFLLGTKTVLADGTAAAHHILSGSGELSLVSGQHKKAFLNTVKEAGKEAELLEEISGVNYSRGKDITLHVFRLKE